jgi:nucleotide-binding universal stress UspA family protein
VYDRILVPLDGSPEAEAALAHARSLASRFRSELLLIRVDAPIPNLPAARYPPEIETAAQSYLRQVAEPMILKQLKLRTLIEYGDPADRILEVAASSRADLIIVAGRHPGGRRLWPAGGVVARLLRGSPIPVLVVPV